MIPADRRHLQTDLLSRVSRSFYLSMRVLPAPMREPVSLAYLLARASDTLADTAAVPVDLRQDCLGEFRSVISAESDATTLVEKVAADFARRQTHEGERELLQKLPECFEWLASLDEQNREAIRVVMKTITLGQSWDLDHVCETADDLRLYTYRVAGCVGEFWTRIGFLNLGRKFADPADEAELLELAAEYGCGLQLVNILRDLGDDLRDGRCYLPRDELRAAGWSKGEWTENESAILSVAEHWSRQCYQGLAAGSSYVKKLRRGRVRSATGLPLILARSTVERIKLAGSEALHRKIKVSRGEVRRAMMRALWR